MNLQQRQKPQQKQPPRCLGSSQRAAAAVTGYVHIRLTHLLSTLAAQLAAQSTRNATAV